MAEKLIAFFDQAESIAGFQGRVRLAMLTRMTAAQARAAADTPEQLRSFEAALEKLAAASAARAEDGGPPLQELHASKPTEQRLRRMNRVVADLIAQRSLFVGQLVETCRRVTEATVETLEIERASVWRYAPGSHIECLDLYERGARRHSAGLRLAAADYPNYFRAIAAERTIAAHNAHLDPRTREFSLSYLAPLGITSMLDVPVWAHGRMAGVVCHEHVGAPRSWSADEENFAVLISNIVALSLESARPAG